MKKYLGLIFLLFFVATLNAQIQITEIGTLPESVSNNAVCEGFIDGVCYLFSFGGIDSTKRFDGIHLRSFRYNTQTGVSERIPDLPDNMGKIAAGASRIGDIIYIIGGYHVFANNTEKSSAKLHRYDIINNTYLEDGPDIPVAIDDQVQVVWRDSLIYVVTGWSDFGNVSNVQIYNPSDNEWQVGTPTGNGNNYKSFGASGTIVNDTIYYFGGATSGQGFGPQNLLRKGIINSDNPNEIEWSVETPSPSNTAYRAVATSINQNMFWIGGSKNTYNYDGIAYNGQGGVPPSNRIIYNRTDDISWNEFSYDIIPMDLRGMASENEDVKYIAGGMIENQEVTNKIFKIEFAIVDNVEDLEENQIISIYPNPFQEFFFIEKDDSFQTISDQTTIEIYDGIGNIIYTGQLSNGANKIELPTTKKGIYYLLTKDKLGQSISKIVKY